MMLDLFILGAERQATPTPTNMKPLNSPFHSLFFVWAILGSALAWSREVITADLARTHEGQPVVMSALLQMAPQPNGRAVLIFPGWPGIPRIETKEGAYRLFSTCRSILKKCALLCMPLGYPPSPWIARPTSGACEGQTPVPAMTVIDPANNMPEMFWN
jgi:hypothetical protein